MYKTRFIRDHALDSLIGDLQMMLIGIEHNDPTEKNMVHYIDSLLISFKTNKEVMQDVEQAIEMAKENDASPEVIGPMARAMTKMQTGIIYLHQLLLKNTKELREQYNIPCTSPVDEK